MVDAHHEIVELDLNPVLAAPDGAVVVDARIRVGRAPPPRPGRARGSLDTLGVYGIQHPGSGDKPKWQRDDPGRITTRR